MNSFMQAHCMGLCHHDNATCRRCLVMASSTSSPKRSVSSCVGVCLKDRQLPCWDLEVYQMSEGRKTQVVLLDDRRLDLLVQPKLYSTELLDIVASHFNLKEKEYFDLSFKDETGHHHWLHLDRKVLEHEFPKKTGPLVLYFGVRFFIESIGYLRDSATIELFFLQAKQSIFKGHLEVDSETAFELAAYVLQAQHGDYTEDESAKKQLKKLPVLPTSVLREHPSLGFCEEQVLAHYRKLEGHTRGSAIVNYMTIIESLPTYGIHYYEVKDKSGIPWWLGLSHKGISLYDYADKRVPRRVFAWKQLENLYFRDKKFSIEVHDPKRIVHTLSSFNLYEDAIHEPLEEFDELSDAISDPTTQVSVSRRTFGPGNVNVHAWLASTPLLTKCIWSMAVSQHQFYLDRKQSKSQLPQVRSMSEIASDLCHSSTSLHSHNTNSSDPGLSRSNSAHSLTLSTYNSRAELTPEALEASRAAYKEMFHALQARKEALEEALRKKTEELKQICLKEGELTGVLPAETPLAPGETLPPIRRRVGTEFALSPKIIDRDKTSEVEEALARLELDLELQDKISKAAFKLAQDKSVAKSVRKQRKQHYHKSHQKLKDIEKKLNEYRERIGKIPMRLQSSVEEPEFISPIGSPSLNRHSSREVGNHGNSRSSGYSSNYQSSPTTPQHMKIITSPKAEVVEVTPPVTPSLRYGGGLVHANSSPFLAPPRPHHYGAPFTSDLVQSQASYQHHAHTTGRQRSSHQEAPPMTGPQHKSAPASPVRQPQGAPRVSSPSPNPGRHGSSSSSSSSRGGYIPNSVYSTRTQYRAQMYPTYSTTPQGGSQSDYERRGGSQSDYERRGGSQSDYENSSRGIPSNRGHHVSRVDRENNHRNDQNLYNVGTNKMATYDSTDELKSPGGEESEDYDSYSSDQEGPGRWPGYHGDLQPRGYGSLDRNLVGGQGHNLPLTELSPSKFGSKRESHSDYRDSPYQIVDMPPIPRNLSGDMPPPSAYRPGEGVPPPGAQHPHGPGSAPSPQDDTSSHNTSIPYIDCSQSSISVPTSGTWYDPKDKQQWANGPTSSQYASPPPDGANPAYQPPTGTNMSYPRPEPTAGHYEKVPAGFDHTSPYQSPPPPEGKTTVTKYQSYVEVSKPFEMSDFYKYSERLRRQRFQDNPGAEGSPHHSRTTGAPAGPPQGTPGRSYHRPAPPSGYNPPRSRPESPYSDPNYKQSTYDPAYTSKQSSPYPSPHNTGGSSYPQHHSPKHVAYQPPKPQTCQPLRGGDNTSSSSTSSPAHRGDISSHQDASFGNLSLGDGGRVAAAFSEEMLAWYDDREMPKTPDPRLVRTPNNTRRHRARTEFI